MNSNLSIQPGYKPSFGIRVSRNFIKAAHNYYFGVEYKPAKVEVFDRKVRYAKSNFDYDEFTLIHQKSHENGETKHLLFAVSKDKKILLDSEDRFRKILANFIHMNKEDLHLKIESSQN